MMTNNKDLPAVEGGVPVRESVLPFFRPSVDESDIESVADTIRSGWLTLGPVTESLENEIRRYIGCSHVVAVSSCSAAMFLGLKALGVGPSDEVITSPLTFASTVHAIIHTGATPVLADIEANSFCISPDELEKKTTAKTKAYLPVHFGGQACRIDDVLSLAAEKGVRVLEDSAHSFGALAGGRKVGSFGDMAAFSFYATKNFTSGDGGCIATGDEEIAERIRLLSYHGMSRDGWARYADRGSWYYEVTEAGFKFNMSDVLSALGLAQLKKIDLMTDGRRAAAERYTELLEDSPYFELPRELPGNAHTWHLFVIRINAEKLRIDRDEFIRALAAENIGCSVHFIPIYVHPFFEPYRRSGESFPVCDDFFSRCISLPMFPSMEDRDVDDVVRALTRIASFYAKD